MILGLTALAALPTQPLATTCVLPTICIIFFFRREPPRERAFRGGLSRITIVIDGKVDKKRWSGARSWGMIGILDDGCALIAEYSAE